MKNKFPFEEKKIKLNYYNTDNEGDPIIIDRVCATDFDSIYKDSSIENIEAYYFSFLYRFWGTIAVICSENKK